MSKEKQKVMIICSKVFYGEIPKYKQDLEGLGYTVVLSNCYENPQAEEEAYLRGQEEHRKFKLAMYKRSAIEISKVNIVFVLNLTKHGQDGYIGGATLLEMYDAVKLEKPIYMLYDASSSIFYDEIDGFSPTVLGGSLVDMPRAGERV